MAQANYVTNAIRALITDARPKTSTNPVRTASAAPIAGLAKVLSPAYPAPKRPRRSFSKSLIGQSDCLPAFVCESTQNALGWIDFRQCDRPFYDLASDATNLRRPELPLAARRVA